MKQKSSEINDVWHSFLQLGEGPGILISWLTIIFTSPVVFLSPIVLVGANPHQPLRPFAPKFLPEKKMVI